MICKKKKKQKKKTFSCIIDWLAEMRAHQRRLMAERRERAAPAQQLTFKVRKVKDVFFFLFSFVRPDVMLANTVVYRCAARLPLSASHWRHYPLGHVQCILPRNFSCSIASSNGQQPRAKGGLSAEPSRCTAHLSRILRVVKRMFEQRSWEESAECAPSSQRGTLTI